jgi:hypothetical protein
MSTSAWYDARDTSEWYGKEKDIAPVVAKLREMGSCCYPADILSVLAEAAPYSFDSGINLWSPSDLAEIARRLRVMAICNSCGSEVSRLRTIFEVDGKAVTPRDECPKCCPGTFEKLELYSKPAMGWEAYPKMYKRRENPLGGWMYEATDEMRVDTEAKIAAGSAEDEEKYQKALALKRKKRRTKPLTGSEIEKAVARTRDQLTENAKQEALERRQYETEIATNFI